MERDYRKFTGPAEMCKAINTLRGIVAGIVSDHRVNTLETQELSHWCALHKHLADRHPFSELMETVMAACEDGVLSDDEAKDILWLCDRVSQYGGYYEPCTCTIQYLSGVIHGIMADQEINEEEIQALQKWLQETEALAGTYPYDELNTLISQVLRDRRIDPDEKEMLMAFFSNLIEFKDSCNLVEADYAELRDRWSVTGICASCPEITFAGKSFCFTGESYKGTRRELQEAVRRCGGDVRTGVSKNLDYLVVGNAGNQCWAYACYGRKIEEAIAMRRNGGKVIIVNETDFWDAVEDALAGIS